jgi:hypothetical protein
MVHLGLEAHKPSVGFKASHTDGPGLSRNTQPKLTIGDRYANAPAEQLCGRQIDQLLPPINQRSRFCMLELLVGIEPCVCSIYLVDSSPTDICTFCLPCVL